MLRASYFWAVTGDVSTLTFTTLSRPALAAQRVEHRRDHPAGSAPGAQIHDDKGFAATAASKSASPASA